VLAFKKYWGRKLRYLRQKWPIKKRLATLLGGE